MSDPIRKLYYGKDIDVTFDTKRCIHSAECVNRLAQVFDTSRRPWVLPDNAPAGEVARVVMSCPSGALRFARKDGGTAEQPPEINLVVITANGPLYVRGLVTIQSEDGSLALEDTRLALCRCGASLNKPFCDNSHLGLSFEDACNLAKATIPEKAVPGKAEAGCLKITYKEIGSFHLDGPFVLVGPDGNVLFEGTHASLCRCGLSQNQPFCDRSHRRLLEQET